MKKIFDFALQCAICNTTETYVVMEPWQVGDECPVICHRCSADDEESAIITLIDSDQVIEEKEELAEWWENAWHHSNKEEVAHLLPGVPWETPEGIIVEKVTAWVVPKSRYPKRDWLTLKEVAEEMDIPKPSLQTWLTRQKLFSEQIQGWIQKTESTTLIHRSVLDRIKELKEGSEED